MDRGQADALPSDYRVATDARQEGPWINRLALCSSPYLRQHASNPVDWRPWGEAAFEAARALDRPLLVSVGYAACHWCHVMEHESFSDPAVAAWMNAHLVAVKVDREERPDVDAFCMDALLALTGEGGWPLNLWLTPDLKPLFGGTYFPPYPRYGVPAFRDVLRRVQDAWTDGRTSVVNNANRLAEALSAEARPQAGAPPSVDLVRAGLAGTARDYNWHAGGWGHGARFPQAPRLELLVQDAALGGEASSAAMLRHLLPILDRSGVHDQLGGGFHRYAVDEDWEVPHFEKMLYDNAQLARLMLRAGSVLEEPRFSTVACRTLEYMLTELRAPSGAFWSSQDADDAGGEGAYYTWTPDELAAAIGPLAPRLAEAYGVRPGGNTERGRSVLRRVGDVGLMSAARARLLQARSTRAKPATDDKIVVAWNGLAVSALASAAALLGEARYRAEAEAAAEAVLGGWIVQGQPRRTLAPDAPPAVLDDYALLAEGLLDLHEATGETRWLSAAGEVADHMLQRLLDAETGALLHGDPAQLGQRRVVWEEGAEPSGAGVALLVLARLNALGLDTVPTALLDRALGSATATLTRQPSTAPSALRAVQLVSRGLNTVVIAGAAAAPDTTALHAAALRPWRPDRVVALVGPEHGLGQRFSALQSKTPGRQARAFFCEGNACLPPITSPAALAARLAAPRGLSGERPSLALVSAVHLE